MIKYGFTHMKYLPKGTIYSIVDIFEVPSKGTVIGYASEGGELFFRKEDDLDKFEFLNMESFKHEKQFSPVEVKFKLNGVWENFFYNGYKLMELVDFLEYKNYLLKLEEKDLLDKSDCSSEKYSELMIASRTNVVTPPFNNYPELRKKNYLLQNLIRHLKIEFSI